MQRHGRWMAYRLALALYISCRSQPSMKLQLIALRALRPQLQNSAGVRMYTSGSISGSAFALRGSIAISRRFRSGSVAHPIVVHIRAYFIAGRRVQRVRGPEWAAVGS